ncbi:MAG: hypothetical protein ABS36_17105 [Acidobacteria bacterium SCN 69-37]|nr:MAG: hypothetical protein ABS36_17105 [Acidobacteria bacterium SCN 69-37]
MVSASARLVLVAGLLCTSALAASQHAWTITFEDDRADQPPTGFTLAAMRQSDAGRWLVQRADNHSYLVHRADPSAHGFALAISNRSASDDVALSARVRFAGASRVGGVVWRYRDAQNYYCLLLDLDRGVLSVYRITAGNRIQLDTRDELELDPEAWHALKIVHVGSDIRVMLGGVRVFDEQDRRSDRRGPDDGRVGVVASGTSEIWFDDISVEAKRGHH